jgi:DNA gyrase subunit A
MRYTEAKLQKLAEEVLADLDKDTVDFKPNFDESLQEPTVLPAKAPLLLMNGSNGIAVGMATNMAPHNLGECCDAICAYIDNPDIDVDGLMEHIKGPDFPTGGIIMGKQGIIDAYNTGRGRVVIRAKTDIEVICASTMTENAASERTLEKAGFIRTSRGVLQDWGYEKPVAADMWFS